MGSYADAWVAKSSRIEVSSPGRCTRCDARLSVYRRPDETQCRALPRGGTGEGAAGVSDPRTRPAPPPLRSRAEQIADELAAEQRAPEPTVRRLPDEAPPVKPALPGR